MVMLLITKNGIRRFHQVSEKQKPIKGHTVKGFFAGRHVLAYIIYILHRYVERKLLTRVKNI